MPAPTIDHGRQVWRAGDYQRFHIVGTNLQGTTLVTLADVDGRAVWENGTVTYISADGTHLYFTSRPTLLSQPVEGSKERHVVGAGQLTITITTPTLPAASVTVVGNYAN